MNVCTISVNINTPDFNYGALLHSYAFQFFLRRCGIKQAEIIDYVTPYLENYKFCCPIKQIRTKCGKREVVRFLVHDYYWYLKRYLKFKRFIKKHITKTTKRYTQTSLEVEDLSKYDAIVCESDVIWTPQLTKGRFDRSFFAALDSMKTLKRIAYSASMGDIDYTEENYKEFAELISHLDYISCRESYAKPVIERFTDKEVEHVLDPVMLLLADDYGPIIGRKVCKNPYLLLYLPVNDNNALRENARNFAKSRNLRIVEISTKIQRNNKNDLTILDAGIEQFLSAIKYAEVIFTNSFHAICFSIIFEKEFYAFSRKYSGKVLDICDQMEIPERYFADDRFVERSPIDYQHVRAVWQKKRDKSISWIINALNGKVNEPTKPND